MLRSFNPRPLILMNSRSGYVLIDKTLYPRFGILITIIPKLAPQELMGAIASCLHLVDISALSEEEKSRISLVDCDELNTAQCVFASEILSIYGVLTEFAERSTMPEDILDWSRDMARTISSSFGFEMKCGDLSFPDVDERNRMCSASYYLSILGFLVIARKYSASKVINLKLHFDEYGIRCDFSFEVASEYLECEPIKKLSLRAKNLYGVADRHDLILYYTQENGIFTTIVFPWVVEPDSSDIKKKLRDFIQ